MTLQNPQWVASSVGRLTVALLSLLPVVVIASGLRNATVLWCAHRRRVPALTRGVRVEGHVVERGRRMFGHDLVSVVVEADVPQTQPGRELAYRERGAALTRKVRFAETCPGDYFTRFAPGQRVALKVDLQHPDCFALLLFD